MKLNIISILGIFILFIGNVSAIDLSEYSGTTYSSAINPARSSVRGSWGNTVDDSLSTYWGITGSTSHQYFGVNSIWVRMSFDVPVDLTKMEIEAYGTISHNPYSNYERLQYYSDGAWHNAYDGVANHARARNSGSGTWSGVTSVRFISSMVAKTWGISGTYYVYDFKAFGTPCDIESDAEFCSRVGGCGDVMANDNCGLSRTVDCGVCFVDSGLNVRVGGRSISIAAEPSNVGPGVKFLNDGQIYKLALVDADDPAGSGFHVIFNGVDKELRAL